MATIGLRDLFYAKMSEDANGVETYGKPVRMAKAIQAQMSTQVAEAKLFADDGVDESVKEFVSGTLTLNVNRLDPEHRAVLLGQSQAANGAVIASGDDDPPYVAIGFRATTTGGKSKYIWLYKVKFAIPDENYQTKGDSIAFQTPSIVGTYIKRNDGKWKIDLVALATDSAAAGWFNEVQEGELIKSSVVGASLNIGGEGVEGGVLVDGEELPLNAKGGA